MSSCVLRRGTKIEGDVAYWMIQIRERCPKIERTEQNARYQVLRASAMIEDRFCKGATGTEAAQLQKQGDATLANLDVLRKENEEVVMDYKTQLEALMRRKKIIVEILAGVK